MDRKTTYLTEKEVSERFKIALQTLRNHRLQRRGFPYCKIGDGKNAPVRYREEDCESCIRRIDPEEVQK